MAKKFLGVGSLILLQIATVANLQPIATNAIYGFSLPFLYLIAVLGFFIPCIWIVAELAMNHPQTGGSYIWVEKAFGRKAGFISITMLWISNLLWYPSVFSFIAINGAYVFAPGFADNKIFIIAFSLLMFWTITLLNFTGVRLSSRISAASTVVGILFPIIFIITAGCMWCYQRHPIMLTLNQTPLIPHFTDLSKMGFFIAIVTSLFGIEVPAVHAGDVENPQKDFPRSLIISGILIVCLLMMVELSLAIIVPPEKLSLMTGIFDGINIFLTTDNLKYLYKPVLFLILIGNIGSIMTWMLGSTRGMFVACKNNHVASIMQTTNRKGSPIGVLLVEGIIFTLLSSVFLMLPQIIDSFWLLLDLASQISIIYYIILFICGFCLTKTVNKHAKKRMFPDNKKTIWLMSLIGIFTSSMAFASGFLTPADMSKHDTLIFHSIMCSGLFLAIIGPLCLLKFKNQQNL